MKKPIRTVGRHVSNNLYLSIRPRWLLLPSASC